jgi:hypothetical protein
VIEKDLQMWCIGLTDVYNGNRDYVDAGDVKKKMQEWAGNNPKFYPHAAQHGFEAWLIPFWHEIQRIADTAIGSRGAGPEKSTMTNLPHVGYARHSRRGLAVGPTLKHVMRTEFSGYRIHI